MSDQDHSGIEAEKVSQIACAQCQTLLDVSALPSFSEVTCPACGLSQIVPARFGGFWLIGQLGAGGMGVIFHAMDKELGRHVALKVMKRELGANEEFVESFRHEAQAAAALNHPNVVQIYSFGQVEGQPYIAMELVSGGRLDEMIADGEPFDETRALEIHLQVVAGLKAASDVGLVHGDIKPANILFGQNGEAKVVDFGLASYVGQQQQGGQVWGTPYYIAPEKARGKRVDFRSDIYSLGATLFHVLTGRPPFDGETSTDVVMARLGQPAPSAAAWRPDLHPETDAMVARMLEMEPTLRYPSYPALLIDMEAAAAASRKPLRKPSATIATVATTAVDAIRKPRLSRRTLAIAGLAAGAALLLAGLAAAGYQFHRHRQRVQAEAVEAAQRAAVAAEAEDLFRRIAALAGVVGQSREPVAALAARIQSLAASFTNAHEAVARATLAADEALDQLNEADDLHAAADLARQDALAAATAEQARAALARMETVFSALIRCHNLMPQRRQDAELALQQAAAAIQARAASAQRAREAAARLAAEKKAAEEAQRLARQKAEEQAKRRPELLQAEYDLLDRTRGAQAGLVAQRQFAAAAKAVAAPLGTLTQPETKAYGEGIAEAFRAMAELKAFVVEAAARSPMRGGWMTGATPRDILKASDTQGLTVALGAAGSMQVSWEQVGLPAFVKIAGHYVERSGRPDAERAKLILAMALLCYESGAFRPAAEYAANAAALDADAAERAARLMPGLQETAAP